MVIETTKRHKNTRTLRRSMIDEVKKRFEEDVGEKSFLG